MARQGIKAASKASQYRDNVKKLDKLGLSKDDFETEKLNLIESILGEFVEKVKGNIQAEDLNVTGSISDISIEADGESIVVTANPHLIYQSRGVSGTETKYDTPHSYTDKKPPASVFVDWIKSKNIQLRDNPKYGGKESPFKDLSDDEKIRRVSYAMANKIYKDGIKPRDVYEKEIPGLIEALQKQIADFCVQYITNNIDVKPEAQRVITNNKGNE